MHDFRKVSPLMWMRGSGKRLRGDALAQVLAAYLATGPRASMIGLYHVTLGAMRDETGHEVDDIRAALKRVSASGFAHYDEEEEIAWVPNAARIELGDGLKEKDKRRSGVSKALRALPQHPFVAAFYHRYGTGYGLETPEWVGDRRDVEKPLPAARKPLPAGRVETESEKETEKERERETRASAPTPPPPLASPLAEQEQAIDEAARSLSTTWARCWEQLTGGPAPPLQLAAVRKLAPWAVDFARRRPETPALLAERAVKAFFAAKGKGGHRPRVEWFAEDPARFLDPDKSLKKQRAIDVAERERAEKHRRDEAEAVPPPPGGLAALTAAIGGVGEVKASNAEAREARRRELEEQAAALRAGGS